MRTACIIAAAACLALTGCGDSNPNKEVSRKSLTRGSQDPLPNVIFILVDTLRADHLSCYGYERKLTPNMDSIAAEGVLFERCIASAPWTLPSVATIQTGTPPCVHHAINFMQMSQMDRGAMAAVSMLDENFDTLAEVLGRAGYETAGVCANKFIKPEYGMAQGFDNYNASFTDNTVRGELVNEAALEWLDSRSDKSKPFYLYLHYMDVHGPYNASPKFMDPLMREVEANPAKEVINDQMFRRINAYLRKPPPESSDPSRWSRLNHYRDYWVARYDAGIAEMDFYLGQLIEQLKAKGVWENSLIVFTADHGEALGERGAWDHGYTQFQSDLHVPLIMKWPTKLPSGQRVTATAGLIGVAPTIFELLGLQKPAIATGDSLLAQVTGDPTANTLVIADAIKAGPRQFAVVQDQWKLVLIEQQRQRLPDGSFQDQAPLAMLFDLDKDPQEHFDLKGQNPAKVRELGDRFADYLRFCQTAKPPTPTSKKEISGETLEQLKALGYTGDVEEHEDDGETHSPASQPAASQP